MSIRKFLHIKLSVWVAVLFIGLCQNTYPAAQQSTWDRLTASPVVKYAPSVITAGVGLYGLHNMLSGGFSRENMLMTLGLAASPVLAQYALYRDEQALHTNPAKYLEPANKLRLAIPTVTLMSFLALHGGFRNFWSTAPYQAALATAGLVAPGAVGAWWTANAEKENDKRRFRTWKEGMRLGKEADMQLKQNIAQNLLLNPSVSKMAHQDIKDAVSVIYEAGWEKRREFAGLLTVQQVDNLMLGVAQASNDVDSCNRLQDILRQKTEIDTEDALLNLVADMNNEQVGEASKKMLETDFRAMLWYFNTIKSSTMMQKIVASYPNAIKNILAMINDRETMRTGNELLDAQQLYGYIKRYDVLVIERELKEVQAELEKENKQKKQEQFLKQQIVSKIVKKAFDIGFQSMPIQALSASDVKIVAKSTVGQIEKDMQQNDLSWTGLEQNLGVQRNDLTENDQLPHRVRWFNALAAEISHKAREEQKVMAQELSNGK